MKIVWGTGGGLGERGRGDAGRGVDARGGVVAGGRGGGATAPLAARRLRRWCGPAVWNWTLTSTRIQTLLFSLQCYF